MSCHNRIISIVFFTNCRKNSDIAKYFSTNNHKNFRYYRQIKHDYEQLTIYVCRTISHNNYECEKNLSKFDSICHKI